MPIPSTLIIKLGLSTIALKLPSRSLNLAFFSALLAAGGLCLTLTLCFFSSSS
jgi:hypothetical protein